MPIPPDINPLFPPNVNCNSPPPEAPSGRGLLRRTTALGRERAALWGGRGPESVEKIIDDHKGESDNAKSKCQNFEGENKSLPAHVCQDGVHHPVRLVMLGACGSKAAEEAGGH